jgi:hypothetical protein
LGDTADPPDLIFQVSQSNPGSLQFGLRTAIIQDHLGALLSQVSRQRYSLPSCA